MRKKPNEVFTPRASVVNEEMYVKRISIEKRLNQVLGSSKFIVIHGESGNGKTWLYKKVLGENDVYFEVINLANFTSAGSLDGVFRQKLGQLGFSEKTKTEDTTIAGVKPFNIGAEHHHKSTLDHASSSSFISLIGEIERRSSGRKRVLVLDNFESVISERSALEQIRAMIISADDHSFAQHGVQVIIVGVPGNLKEAIAKGNNSGPVANRLTELPEVERMSQVEARELIRKGFIDELELAFDEAIDEKEVYKQICWHSDRIAQHIHEICLIISQNSFESNFIINEDIIEESIKAWADDTLSSDMAVIEGVMNARDTKAGRKNQVLFAMGASLNEDMKYSDVEAIVKENFDVGTANLNVSQILSGFAKAENPLIRRTPKGDAWRFVSPKFKMAIRSNLIKSEDGKVIIKTKR